jgi:hypothetical protein
VGTFVGVRVGRFVGALVGLWMGFFVGALVGNRVGTLVSFSGVLVGGLIGVLAGPLTGALVGALIGALVGDLLGTFVGAFFGTFVGAFIGAFVEGFTGDFTGGVTGAFVGSVTGAWVGVFVRTGVNTQTAVSSTQVSTVTGLRSLHSLSRWQFMALRYEAISALLALIQRALFSFALPMRFFRYGMFGLENRCAMCAMNSSEPPAHGFATYPSLIMDRNSAFGSRYP